MARAARDPTPGVYHVAARSISSAPLFHDDLDRLDFNLQLAAAIKRPTWTCIAVCLMTTHYHLIVAVADESLPNGMHQLNSRYAQRLNARHGLRGHVFASRYWARRIETDDHLLTAFRYVARNPVAAGLCRHPEDWRWSSYASAIGNGDGYEYCEPAAVIAFFGKPRQAAVGRMRLFVEAP